MQTARVILIAADLSESSVDAFRLACSLATGDETRLFVLHVIDPEMIPKEASASEVEIIRGTRERQVREVYVPDRPVAVEYRTTQGSPAAEIIRMADEHGANLIVMGTHGRTGLRRLVAGSVANAVLRGANCPVMALRSLEGRRSAGEFRSILHPTDFSKASSTAAGAARSLARDLGAQLVVLHVAPADVYLEGNTAEKQDTRDCQESLDELRRGLDGPDLKYPVETRLTRGFEVEQILRVAQEVDSDLIVMGTHGRTGLTGVLLGNTAESILPKAPCAVMVVKPPQPAPQSTSGRPAGAKGVTVF